MASPPESRSKISCPGSPRRSVVTARRDLRVEADENSRRRPTPHSAGARPDARAGAADGAARARPRARPRARGHLAGRTFPGAAGRTSWSHLSGDPGTTGCSSLAAGVVFYSLLALFPAIAAGVSFYALFADAARIGKHLAHRCPTSCRQAALDLLHEQITRIAAQERRAAHPRLPAWLRHCAVERQCRHEGDLRCAQHHLRRGREARLHLAQSGVAVLHARAPSPSLLLAIGAVVVFPLFLAAFGLTSMDEPLDRLSALAGDVRADHRRACGALPLRAEPADGEMALAQRRQRVRGVGLARRCRRCSPGIWRTSPTTTRPTARSAP